MHTLKYALVVLSLIGIADSGYLSYARFTNSTLDCNLLEGCNAVASSPFSTIFGIVPLAYLGLAFYIALLIVSLFLLAQGTPWVRGVLFVFALGGFLSSLYFVYIQIAVIKEICIYCMLSAVNATVIFILSLFLFKKEKVVKPELPTDSLDAQLEA